MKCTEARRLMHLNRPGELTEDESRELERHCAGCASCAAERENVRASERFLERLRAFTPAPGSPEALTSSIMVRIRTEPRAERQARQKDVGQAGWLLDWILGWFYTPAFRYSSAIVIAVAVLAFVGEQLSIVNSVSNLESRLAGPQRSGIQMAYALNLDSIRRLRKPKDLDRLLQLQIPTNAGDRILVSQGTILALQQLIAARGTLQNESENAFAMIDSLVRHLQKEGAVSLKLMPEGENR
jgi:hypothetical protein